MQKLQDWITQQWVILRGSKFKPEDYPWLMGPFGNLDNIGAGFIQEFAAKNNLIIDTETVEKGLIRSMKNLVVNDVALKQLSPSVIAFYEKTSKYDLDFAVKWNPFFKPFGILLNRLFSNRINQLNIPTQNIKNPELINSEIVNLLDAQTKEVKYTFWQRSIRSTGQVVYSGAYGVCTLPSGKVCIKAVFPLPNGNATVIMNVRVNADGALVLDASGERFGDAGFYFLLKDAKGTYGTQYIKSFRDQLIVAPHNEIVLAEQKLTLWHQHVLAFNYTIKVKP